MQSIYLFHVKCFLLFDGKIAHATIYAVIVLWNKIEVLKEMLLVQQIFFWFLKAKNPVVFAMWKFTFACLKQRILLFLKDKNLFYFLKVKSLCCRFSKRRNPRRKPESQRKAPEAAFCLIKDPITRSHSLFSGKEFRSLRRTAKGAALWSRHLFERWKNTF